MYRTRAKILLQQVNRTYLGQGGITEFMTKQEIDYIYTLWQNLPGSYSFNGVICAIANGSIKTHFEGG